MSIYHKIINQTYQIFPKRNKSNHLLYIEALSSLMRDTTTTGPGTRARRGPWSPRSLFKFIRIQHEATRQIAFSMLTTMSFVPQLYVMLKHRITKIHLAHCCCSTKSSKEVKQRARFDYRVSVSEVARKTWEHRAKVSR